MAKLPLHQRMQAYVAAFPTLDTAPEMKRLAGELETAIGRAYAKDGTKDDVKRMLGCWARARRLWCDVTGEPLV